MAAGGAVWGSASRGIEGLTEIVEEDAQMLMLNPVFDHMEHLEAFQKDIIPSLRLP